MKKNVKWFLICMFVLFSNFTPVYGMHIMEGFLPKGWSIFWYAVCIPFVIIGGRKIVKITKEYPEKKMLLACVGAFVFVLSAMKLPSVTGSCSHRTGIALGAIFFGPWVMAVLGVIVLLFQAILLAHGGITTLGANLFSMAIVGAFVAYFVYKLLRKLNVGTKISIFMAAMLGDLLTYVVTAIQLGVVHFDPALGIGASIAKFMGIFAVTQVWLAIAEGLVTVMVYNLLIEHNADLKDGVNVEV